MPTVDYPTNPNTDTVFVTDDGGKRTRSLKTVLVDGTIDYPKSANVKDCYVTIDGKKQRALMTADISKDGVVEYPDGNNSTKGYVTVDGKKHRVVLTATLAGGEPAIDELNVTPSTSAQTITAPEGTDGYSPVNVSAVTSSIDANIQAGNIKKDVTILGVTGSYEAPAPTGTINITTNGTHDVSSYANADVNVPAGGTMYGATAESFLGTIDASGILQNPTTPTNLDFTGVKGLAAYTSSMGVLFRRFQNLGSIKTVTFPDLEYVVAYGLSNCFYNNTSLTSAKFASLKFSQKGGFDYCFSGCTNLETAELPLLVQAESDAVSGMQGIFDGNTKLKTVRLDSFYGISSKLLQYAFRNCSSLEDVYLSSFHTTKANALNNSLTGTNGVKLHFPSNMQSNISVLTGYPNFGGTNTSVLFDMHETASLLQSNEQTQYNYYRLGGLDTATSSAWINTDSVFNIGINNVLYSSGTTLPAVGDNLYSDPECTVVATTVRAITV